MKNKLILLVGIIVVVVLLAYMFTFQVRYDEVAVRTFFNQADPVERDAEGTIIDAGSLYFEPGLQWRWPWPVHKVYKYSTKLHLLEDELAEIQTNDNHAIVVKTYLTWRIARPYQFHGALGSISAARDELRPLMRNLNGVIGSYDFDELVNTDSEALKLTEIEQKCAEKLREQLVSTDWGIEVEQVGIRRILLPEDTTEDVFERMRATRERMAENILAKGRAEADTIRNEAEATKQIILDFANRRAQEIRAQGDQQAAMYYDTFREHQDLTIFLDHIEMLKASLPHHTTFILDANEISVFEPFINQPGIAPEGDGQAQEVDAPSDAPKNAPKNAPKSDEDVGRTAVTGG